MARTERKELRLTPEMVERIDDARGDVSFNRFVERALESALSTEPVVASPAQPSRGATASASSRAPKEERLSEAQSVKHQSDWMLARQRKLNERKS